MIFFLVENHILSAIPIQHLAGILSVFFELCFSSVWLCNFFLVCTGGFVVLLVCCTISFRINLL